MSKHFFHFALMLALPLSGLFYACEKDASSATTEEVTEYVDETVYRLQGEGNLGRFGCYELVFPLSLQFPDSSVVEVADYETLVDAVKTWKENNPDVEGRPTFVFPIEVISEDGEVIAVNSKEELKALARECRGNFFGHHPGQGGQHGHHGHSGNCTPCFEIVFPLTLQFPDGTTAEAADRAELKSLVREWKEANPDSEERPEILFPIDVTLEDGTTVTVNSKEELKELRESCAG